MKKLLLIMGLLLVILVGCRSNANIRSCTYISDDSDKIVLRCKGFGATERDANTDANRYAIEQLLFRGVPNSMQKVPILNIDEKQARSQYPDYLKELLDQGRCSTFVVSSLLVGSGRSNGFHWTICDVTINMRALRLDLEQNGMIRKFGY